MENRQRALLAAASCRLAAAGAAMQGTGAYQWDRLLYSLSPTLQTGRDRSAPHNRLACPSV
jgi:hypothetical protein